MREGGTSAPGSRKLEAETALGKHDAFDLWPEHAARDASKVANEKNVPAWTEKFLARHEANQVGFVGGNHACQRRVKLRAWDTLLSNHAFHIPLNPSLLPFPIGDTNQFTSVLFRASGR